MNNRKFLRRMPYLACAYLLLQGCSSQPVAVKPEPAKPAPLPELVKIDDRDFDTETLYALLVAEFAGDRERFDVMLSNYVQQARATRDIEVTARASRLARYLNVHDASLEMALQWAELEPGNLEAHFNATVELVEANQLLPAFAHAELLAQHTDTSGLDAIAARALQIEDQALVEDLLTRYRALRVKVPEHGPLLIGLSLLQQQTNDLELALRDVLEAQRLDPENFQAAAQEIRVLEQMGRKREAMTKLGELVERFPGNQRLRLQYARTLVKEDITAAESQFKALLAANPGDPDITLTVALIQYELQKYSEAKGHFLLLTEDSKRKDTAHAYLGRILAAEGQPEAAMRHLKQVAPGADYLSSLSKLSDLYIEQGQTQKALTHLTDQGQLKGLAPEMREGIVLIKSTVLNRTGQVAAAIDRLSGALTETPDATGLLYARAMLYSQENDLERAEQDLQRVIAIDPDNAAALNALGYTLADKTNRLDEAYELIKRAFELAPEDPAVIDSMGWVEYRRGNHQRALALLTQALQVMQDPEIAAHLGEVLWVTGDHNLAREVWRTGLQANPDSAIILDTMQRLNAVANP